MGESDSSLMEPKSKCTCAQHPVVSGNPLMGIRWIKVTNFDCPIHGPKTGESEEKAL